MGFLAFGLATIACGIRKQTFFKEDVFENLESGHKAIETKNPLLYYHTSQIKRTRYEKSETILILSNEDKLLGEDSVTEWLRGSPRDVEGTTIE
ncbi:7080_t:CDS:2 [Funneliformis caledonium]|uniref:7080_t:CDS:1 n=1 Tax=Funneliformis caledonium TaxID=1117310 RepID=A0A9N8Z2G6_9GLOM|nr:7080_t:CDS:2 [Funneliformis caledonium]